MTEHIPTLAQRQATRWHLTLSARADHGQQQAFERWLAASPEHAQAWAETEAAWAASEAPARRLAAEDEAALQQLLTRMDSPVRRGRRWTAALASAASVVLLVGALAGWRPDHWLADLSADHLCPAGPVCPVTLSDGSQLTLDADTAIAVDFDHGSRLVKLLRGTAFFKVTHTGAPFRVRAGDGEVRVMGTEFEVRREPDGARVTVLSGRVSVRATAEAPEQILTANDQVDYAAGVASAVAKVDSPTLLGWRDGWLSYDRAPLRQVVADLAAHYPGQILMLDSAQGERTLSGSFPSRDPLATLDSLQRVMGFQQDRLFGRWVVLR